MTADGDLPTLAAGLLLLARHQAGISQAELGRRAGVSPSMVCSYERDRRQPTLVTLLRLLRAAGCELAMQLAPCDDRAGRRDHRQGWPKDIEESWDDYVRSRVVAARVARRAPRR